MGQLKKNDARMMKYLTKIDALMADALRESEKGNVKRQTRRWDAAEKQCRKVLAMSRSAANAGEKTAVADSWQQSAVAKLSQILMRQGRVDEARTLLAESCPAGDGSASEAGLICMAYYGAILCQDGAYHAAGGMLLPLMEKTDALGDDPYALSLACGYAGMAFTYDDDTGYNGKWFEQPVVRLLSLRDEGVKVDSRMFIQAAYFAASEALYQTCYDPVSATDTGKVTRLAQLCVQECRRAGIRDFYEPAAMRLEALAAARDCQFADCAALCTETITLCSSYSYEMGQSPFGSIPGIVADMNLLLGILHYRVGRYEEAVGYFSDCVAALEADAQGKPLEQAGWQEIEYVAMRMTFAEKAAFAYRYMGLSMFSQPSKYTLSACVSEAVKAVELLERMRNRAPYFGLLAAGDCQIIAQMCEKRGDEQQAEQFETRGRSSGMEALTRLLREKEQYDEWMELLRAGRRTALRLGLLELYGDETRIALLLSEKPHVEEESHLDLAYLNFAMGDYCRVVGRNEEAVAYFDAVAEHTFDQKGKAYYDVAEMDFWESASVGRAASYAAMGQMPQARDAYRAYVGAVSQTGDEPKSRDRLVKYALLSREIGLNPAECAAYFLSAAKAYEDAGETLPAAELYNQEGICWYNADPGHDAPDGDEAPDILTAQFAQRELEAFENAYRCLKNSDQKDDKVIDLLPSLLSNIGECHVRGGQYGVALPYYREAVAAFEKLFAHPSFEQRERSQQVNYVYQYGSCFKTLGEIYDALDDNPATAEAFTKAIEAFERLLPEEHARHELAFCLNARGCIRYRLGDYRGEVDDVTRAIALKENEEGSEMVMAIMLKNRSDAYRELGNFKNMQSDLAQSIDLLDHSGMPDEVLNGFYGSHWFSMGVCQEEMHRIGQAADAYRKAAGYMRSSEEREETPHVFMEALCHFRRGVCLCRRDEQEFYGALGEYNSAIDLLEHLPASGEKDENLRQVLSSRANLYEVFREIDLAQADYRRAERLGGAVSEGEN